MSEETIPAFTSLLKDLGREKFDEILSASPRKARDVYYIRAGIKKPKKRIGIKALSLIHI